METKIMNITRDVLKKGQFITIDYYDRNKNQRYILGKIIEKNKNGDIKIEKFGWNDIGKIGIEEDKVPDLFFLNTHSTNIYWITSQETLTSKEEGAMTINNVFSVKKTIINKMIKEALKQKENNIQKLQKERDKFKEIMESLGISLTPRTKK